MATTKRTTYAGVKATFQKKINAYKTLFNQCGTGAGQNRPSPTQLNTFSKWIDKGAIIQNVSPTQLNRWSGSPKDWTPGSAKTCMSKKFGKTCIKAVAFNKTGGFIVATSPTKNGRSFRFGVTT